MGKKYGVWQTGEAIDQGGQANVYMAEDTSGGRVGVFALKHVRNPKRRGRFLNEVVAVKTLKHPNVIPLVDNSALDALPNDKERQYIVMPFAEGGNLVDAKRFQGDVERTIGVAQQIAAALAEAHAHRIIHRDIKPANILFQTASDDNIWVGDFGICLIDDGRDRETQTGEPVGPVMFMAPELEAGDQLDVGPEADVYSLGKVIFYMLSGGVTLPREKLRDMPFREILDRQGMARLNALLSNMICDRETRIKTMAEVIQALDSIVAGMNSTGDHPGVDDASRRLTSVEAVQRNERAAAKKAIDNKEAELTAARLVVVDTVVDQLEKISRDRGEPGRTSFHVTTKVGRGKCKPAKQLVSAVEAVEICRHQSDGDKRTWALTFQVFWRPSSDKQGRVGLFVEVEVREADGRSVTQCRSPIGRRKMSRDRYSHFLTSIEPAVYEQAPGEWLGSDAQLRKFVSEFFAAFHDLIARGILIFVQASLEERDQVRRGR